MSLRKNIRAPASAHVGKIVKHPSDESDKWPVRPEPKPVPYVLPPREWDRASEVVRMFIATGRLSNARTQSMLLVSEPGNGKSELLDRFKDVSHLRYVSDLTVHGLHVILRAMGKGETTHIVATEFQKFFLRKASTAENTLGTLCQMMEEGVGNVDTGRASYDFAGAQGGLIGAITHETMSKWRRPLSEFGFWSRCAAFEWAMPMDELRGVMRSISRGDQTDLQPLRLVLPKHRIEVRFPVSLSDQFEEFVTGRLSGHTPIRAFQRMRALAMGCALLAGRTTVHAYDVEKVVAFDRYWTRMIKGT